VSINADIIFTETLYNSSVTNVRRGVYQNSVPIVVKSTSQDVPDERLIEQYRTSCLAQQKVCHPAVNRVVKYVLDGAGCVLLLEDTGGESLHSWINNTLKENVCWPLENSELFHLYLLRLLRWSVILAEGISAFHQKDVIHNDINPANITVNEKTDQLQIIDFGAAFPSGSNINDWTVTDQNRTLTYISPEQTGRLNRNIDYRSDYYAFGATLYQLFSGRPPFIASDLPELIHCHIARHPVPLDTINPLLPASLSALVQKLMAKAPEDRYQNGRCLIQDLEAIEFAVKTGMPLCPDSLGANDVPEKLLIPTKLYGREGELLELQKSLSGQGDKPALIVVEGEGGCGKTSLVNEAILHFVEQPVLILWGKTEAYNKSPHLALSQALSQIVDMLLELPDKIFLSWRDKLLDDLNKNPHTLIGLCPGFRLLFETSDVLDKGAPYNVDIQLKLHTAIFFRHLSILESVLLIIDDVQWCDAPSLGLLEALVKENNHRITLMFTCREEEVGKSHPYTLLKESVVDEGFNLVLVPLGNLNSYQVSELLAATFHNPDRMFDDIVDVVMKKTLGNPLFLREFLKVAYQKNDGSLFYDNSVGVWRWDCERLNSIGTSGNVAALLIETLHQQSEETQELLQWAACLGTRFNEDLLSKVSGKDIDWIRTNLNPVYQQGYLQRSVDQHGSYIFNHDRIMHAYYELQSVDDIVHRHGVIGKIFMADGGCFCGDPLPHLFEAFSRPGFYTLPGESEMKVLVRTFLEGAVLAKEKSAYKMSLQYVKCALELVDICKDRKEANYKKVYEKNVSEILLLRGMLAYLVSDTVLAESSYDRYRSINSEPLLQASSYAQQTPLAFVLDDFETTVSYSLKCLALLGVDVPEIGGDISQQIKFQWKAFYENKGGDKVDVAYKLVPEDSVALTTLHSITANVMLLGLSSSRFQWAEWFGLVGMNSFLINGFTKYTPQLLGVFDSMLCSIGQPNIGGVIAEKSREIVDEDSGFPGGGFVYNTIGTYGGRYCRSMYECIECLDVGAEYSFSKGEYLPYLACISNKMIVSFSAGIPLLKLKKEAERLKVFLLSCGGFVSVGKFYYRLIDQLVDASASDLLERSTFSSSQWDVLNNSIAYGGYCHLRLQRHFWLGEYDNVVNCYVKDFELLKTVHAFSIGDDNHFLHAISQFLNTSIDDPFGINAAFTLASESVQYINAIAITYPPNFKHKALLIEAEQQRLKGDPRATDTYQLAAIDAKENGFIQMYALTHELHASYWQQQGRLDYVKYHIKKALQGYHRWGCALKIEQLQRRFGQFLLQQAPSEFRDQRTLLKISNEITEELGLNQRLANIIELVVKHTGAERGTLLLKENNTCTALSVACLDGSEVLGHEASIMDLPIELVNGCTLFDPTLLSGTEANDTDCRDCIMNQAQNTLSLLCYPVEHKGECQSLLLLTHSVADVFTEQHRQLLQSLVPHIAVSIENAQLYQEHQAFNVALEKKVTQRTRELSAANDELQAFTASVSHDLRAPLRAIIGFTEALAEDFNPCLGGQGAQDAAQLVEESENMREIINGLIVLSRSAQSGLRREEVNLSTLVEDKLRWLRIMEVEHEVASTVQQGLTAHGDLRLLKQIVDNLITNAWKFSHGVGSPAISFGMVETNRSQHTFYVLDNGVGFDANNAVELFSPFRRFHDAGVFEGSGIGLATVFRIIKRHGGEIWAESEVNQGASFYFTLNGTAT